MKKEADFLKKYNYDTSVVSKSIDFSHPTQKGMLDIDGEDYELALSVYKKDPKRVWSSIDRLDDGMYFVPGFHTENVLYYVVTLEENDSPEEYLIHDYYNAY